MNRKDKTVKQLQAECRKRKIGFMMNWTKAALTNRLEDEDKRELASKKVEDKASKEINKAKKELELIQTKHDKNLVELKKSDPEAIKKQIKEQMLKDQKQSLHFLKQKLTAQQTEQDLIIQRSNVIAKECIEIVKEIKVLQFSIANLK